MLRDDCDSPEVVQGLHESSTSCVAQVSLRVTRYDIRAAQAVRAGECTWAWASQMSPFFFWARLITHNGLLEDWAILLRAGAWFLQDVRKF